MKVKFKKLHPDAVIPSYAKAGDAGLDLTATSAVIKEGYIEYGTGLAVEIPEGYVGFIFPRSSNFKTSQILSNSVGVVDSGYIGEIKFMYYTPIEQYFKYDDDNETVGNKYAACDCWEVGQRIGQLIIMPYPKIEIVETDQLSSSERGDSGFGSSGK